MVFIYNMDDNALNTDDTPISSSERDRQNQIKNHNMALPTGNDEPGFADDMEYHSVKEDKNVKRFLNGQDVIFQALDRIRCFQPFGFRPKKDHQEEDQLSLQSQEIDVDLPDGIYVRDRRGNWEHIKEDVKLHNRNLTENCINLVRWMGGKYIRFL